MMLARARLRRLVVQQLLSANTLATSSVFENRALPLATAKLPAITVCTPIDHKESLLRGGPQFTSVFGLQLILRVTGPVDDVAIAMLERLIAEAEAATLSNQIVINQVQQFRSVRTDQKVVVDGGVVVAEAVMEIECEVYEDYRRPPAVPFTAIDITLPNTSDQLKIVAPLPQ